MSKNYWIDIEVAIWGYLWTNETKAFILNHRQKFLTKYISLCVKFGINVPVSILSGMTTEELAKTVLKSEMYNDWYFIHKLYLHDNPKKLSFPDFLFYSFEGKVIHGYFSGINPIVEFSEESSEGNSPNKIWSFSNEKNKSILFYLDTDAFFSEISNRLTSFDHISFYDNSLFSYLNTTRLNSYIRDLTYLMFEFGATELLFDNAIEMLREGEVSEYIQDIYLKVSGEVLFYEDIYDLLPEEHKYKEFEKIHLEIADTNYKKYLEAKAKK